MNVGELRAEIAGLPDETRLVVHLGCDLEVDDLELDEDGAFVLFPNDDNVRTIDKAIYDRLPDLLAGERTEAGQ